MSKSKEMFMKNQEQIVNGYDCVDADYDFAQYQKQENDMWNQLAEENDMREMYRSMVDRKHNDF